MSIDTLIWSEKYRPKNLDDCIIPESVLNDIRGAIANGNVPNLLLYGSAGTGKTSVCRAIANELDAELLYINASLERNIDVIRNQVMTFSSSVSLRGAQKIVLFDESDGMSRQAADSLKGILEQFPTVRFFFTSNHINKIIDPIKSRCVNINFKIDGTEKAKVAATFFKRVLHILDTENIKYDKKTVAEVVNKYFPDFRRTLNELQRHSSTGEIDASILKGNNSETFATLFAAMKVKNFTEVRKWVGQNSDVDAQQLYRDMYDNAYELFEPACIPQIVLIFADYMVKSTYSVDQEILLTASLVEIMVAATWKK